MKMKFEMVPVDKLYLGNEINPVKLTDVADTVFSSLSDKENIIYMIYSSYQGRKENEIF
jgi:hypothetical protein